MNILSIEILFCDDRILNRLVVKGFPKDKQSSGNHFAFLVSADKNQLSFSSVYRNTDQRDAGRG